MCGCDIDGQGPRLATMHEHIRYSLTCKPVVTIRFACSYAVNCKSGAKIAYIRLAVGDRATGMSAKCRGDRERERARDEAKDKESRGKRVDERISHTRTHGDRPVSRGLRRATARV